MSNENQLACRLNRCSQAEDVKVRWKMKTWWVNACKWFPLEFPLKNATTRVVAIFFNAKTDEFSTWLTRSPHFLERFPRSWFFREICSNCCCAPAIVCIADEPNKFQHWHHFNWFFNKDILQGRRTIAHLRALENRAFENHMVLSLLEFSLTKTHVNPGYQFALDSLEI